MCGFMGHSLVFKVSRSLHLDLWLPGSVALVGWRRDNLWSDRGETFLLNCTNFYSHLLSLEWQLCTGPKASDGQLGKVVDVPSSSSERYAV